MSVSQKGSKIFLRTDSHTYYYDESLPILGSGAMGIVYKGIELSTNKVVAIKRLKDRFANIPAIRRRAHQEANLMFSHPNLVEMHGCCEVAPNRGPLFIISSYVDGETIDCFINNNIRQLPQAEQRICNMFLPVLDALSYIHHKQILHLDIKPSNIMVEKGRNVRLMDLGIANVSADTEEISSGMMGTPKYAAPEQFANGVERRKLSCATDIYEAGVTLYELITNNNPFPNEIEKARQLHMSAILEKVPSISYEVLSVIQKATATVPSARYQQASEMKAALIEALRSPRPTTRYTLKFYCAIAIAIIFVIGIMILLMQII